MRDEVNDYFVKEMSRDDIPVKWWAFSDSNRGHSVYETGALRPTELKALISKVNFIVLLPSGQTIYL